MSVGVWPDEQRSSSAPRHRPGRRDSMGFPLSSVSSIGADAPPLPADSGVRAAGRVRARRPARVGRRRRRAGHPLVARVGQQVRQRAAGLPRGLQPVGAVHGLELPGQPAADDPLPGDRHRPHRLPRHPPARLGRHARTRPRPSWAPACRAAASARRTPTPPSCGTSPRSARRSSSSDALGCGARVHMHGTSGTVVLATLGGHGTRNALRRGGGRAPEPGRRRAPLLRRAPGRDRDLGRGAVRHAATPTAALIRRLEAPRRGSRSPPCSTARSSASPASTCSPPDGPDLLIAVAAAGRRQGAAMALGPTIVARAQPAGVLAHRASAPASAASDVRGLGQALGFQVYDLGRGRLDLVRTLEPAIRPLRPDALHDRPDANVARPSRIGRRHRAEVSSSSSAFPYRS